MKIAAFVSHPIQHLTPLWEELSTKPDVELSVFYYSKQGITPSLDIDFGVNMAWDIDLLAGHTYRFLSRRWPTRDPYNYFWYGLNKGFHTILRQGWDAVYIPGYAHLNNWIVLHYCKKMGIPVLCQGDGSILTAFEKSRFKLALKNIVVRTFVKRIDGCLAIGNHSREYFAYYGARPETLFFCPIPVDIKRFIDCVKNADEVKIDALRQKYHIPKDKTILSFSGKLIPRKRPQDILNALKLLARSDLFVLYIGSGPVEEELKAQLGDYGVVTGFVNQSEIPLLLSLASIAVMPSSYDPHPLAVTESLCLGKPVILSSKCGCYGPDDVLREGQDGYVYPCGNVQQLAEKIKLLVDDAQQYQRMSQRAVELAQTQSPQQTADAFVNIIHTIQANKART